MTEHAALSEVGLRCRTPLAMPCADRAGLSTLKPCSRRRPAPRECAVDAEPSRASLRARPPVVASDSKSPLVLELVQLRRGDLQQWYRVRQRVHAGTDSCHPWRATLTEL